MKFLGVCSLLLVAATLRSCLAVPEGGFAPLQCNIDASIDSNDCVSNTVGFSTLFSPDESATLTIPCGTCVVMDYTDGSTITIPGGLNVVGRLHFPAAANLVLRTTSVFVQGKWSMDAPSDGNTVTVSLYGSEEKTFYPHDPCCQNIDDVYGYDCSCSAPEGIGKKPFVIAGGQLDIRAFDKTCSSWSKLKDVNVNTMQSIKVDTNFASCLRPGDDLLVTSDSRNYNDHSTFTVDSVDIVSGDVILQETMPRIFPSEAYAAEPQLAVEVALLRRDVIFTAEEDPEETWIGGHSIVYFTPTVVQTIQGIRFDNFGQEGVLGRYPIHFHKSGDTASLISKNVIINSNQRCVFIHDTNTVTIDDNVAFDTRGHCYATETGAEVYNIFSNNLGAYTKELRRDNGQSDFGFGGHGHAASTFWFRNMKNTFVNNVAAGCVDRGYWIELKEKYDSTLNDESFKGNLVHSSPHGLITYQRGWLSSELSVVQDFVAFNCNEGVKFHITGNVTFKDALFADNQIAIRYGAWNKEVTFEDSLFMLSNPRRGRTVAIITFNNRPDFHKNIVFKNSIFRNFATSRTLKFEDHNLMEDDMGDPAHLYGVTRENCDEYSLPSLGECGSRYRNFFFEDFDGTMAPASKGPGFYLRDHELTQIFLPENSCIPMPNSEPGCLAYCEGICVRLVHITPLGALDITNTAYGKLQLTDTTGTSYNYPLNSEGTAIMVLPAGQYEGEFIDQNGDPLFIDTVNIKVFSEPQCGNFVTKSDFVFPNSRPPTEAPSSMPSISPTKYYDMSYASVGSDLKCYVEDRLFKMQSITTVNECRDRCFNVPGCNYFSYSLAESKTCMACSIPEGLTPIISEPATLTVVGNDFDWGSHKLKNCEGDCDGDSDCEGILKCYQRGSSSPGPGGCDGAPSGGTDYCYQPEGDFYHELEHHNNFDAYELTSIKSPEEFGYELWNGLSGLNQKCPQNSDRLFKMDTLTRKECYNLCKNTLNCGWFTWGEDHAGSNLQGDCILCQSDANFEYLSGANTYTIIGRGYSRPPTEAPSSMPSPPTEAPSSMPSISPTKYYDMSYASVGSDLKCYVEDRLFKMQSITTVNECRDRCFNVPGCNYFSYSLAENKTCMACSIPEGLTPIISEPATLTVVGNDFDWGSHKLKNCEGDCDGDSDCEGILKCYQRGSSSPGPGGCDGAPSGGTDYCYQPEGDFYHELEHHNNFDAYELTSIKSPEEFGYELWNGLSGLNQKCPQNSDRLFKTDTSTRKECYNLCKNTLNCGWFTWGEDHAGSNLQGDCILCQSDANFEHLLGANTYTMIRRSNIFTH